MTQYFLGEVDIQKLDDSTTTNKYESRPAHLTTISLNGDTGHLSLGGPENLSPLVRVSSTTNGNLVLKDKAGKIVVGLDAEGRSIFAGGNGRGGDLILQDASGKWTIGVYGDKGKIIVGASGHSGVISMRNTEGHESILLDAHTGDITLPNADCAEDFDLAELADVGPGTTVVLDDGGLRESSEPYDRKVVGVISGAGDFRPGIVLDRRRSAQRRASLSMVGKVFCKVDATPEPVQVGDLLTTSSIPGHAMKASDPSRAFGAVIGKALRPLQEGRELIPIIVALQ